MTHPALRTDFGRPVPKEHPGRARRRIQPIRNELLGVFGTKARIGGVTSPTSGANHALRERSRRGAFHQCSAIPDAETVLRGVLGEAHRAALRWGGARFQIGGLVGGGGPAAAVGPRPRFIWPSPTAKSPRGQREQDDQRGADRPSHARIVPDPRRMGPQKSPGGRASRAPSVESAFVLRAF